MDSTTEFHFIQAELNQTLLESLYQHTQPHFSKQQLKQFMQKGAVWVSEPMCSKTGSKNTRPGRVRRAKKPLKPGSKVWFYYNPQVLHQTIEAPQLIADRETYSVWYKPKGVLSQGSKWGDHSTLNRWIEMHYLFPNETSARPCWIVHRLDKATDGLMLIAHSKKAAQQLASYFEQHLIHKTYHATVQGQFPRQRQTYCSPLDGKTAISHVHLLHYDALKNRSRVAIQIETGRKHQIRRHLSEAGYPIVGDRLHGNADIQEDDLQLTAITLCILNPEKKTLSETCFSLLDVMPQKA